MYENDFYYQMVPSLRPKLWFTINTSLAIYSSLLAIHILIAIKISGERPDAAASYKIWDFSTTIFWCIEAGLEAWWSYMKTSITQIIRTPTTLNWWDIFTDSEYLINVGEITIAIYSLFDSGATLWKWDIRGVDFQMSLLSVLVNLGVFLYAMIRDWRKIKNDEEGMEKETYTQIV